MNSDNKRIQFIKICNFNVFIKKKKRKFHMNNLMKEQKKKSSQKCEGLRKSIYKVFIFENHFFFNPNANFKILYKLSRKRICDNVVKDVCPWANNLQIDIGKFMTSGFCVDLGFQWCVRTGALFSDGLHQWVYKLLQHFLMFCWWVVALNTHYIELTRLKMCYWKKPMFDLKNDYQKPDEAV